MLRQLNRFISPSVNFLNCRTTQHLPLVQAFSSNEPTNVEPHKKNLSKAMKAYLERAREHDEFMRQQNIEFQLGKRHLANMMGENPDTFTQKDIDAAIEYLFPSGLFVKAARPFMRPPEEVFPQRKAAEFDETGRPHHYLFYTGRPNFYQLMHEIVDHINEAYKFEDVMIRKGQKPDPNLAIEMSGFQWIDKKNLEKELVEPVGDKDYENFVNTMERLIKLPYSYRSKEFIFKYTKPLMSATKTYEAPEPKYDSEGRAYITTYECLRKRARGHVTIRSPGTGKITINGTDITYFEHIQQREQITYAEKLLRKERLIYWIFNVVVIGKKNDNNDLI